MMAFFDNKLYYLGQGGRLFRQNFPRPWSAAQQIQLLWKIIKIVCDNIFLAYAQDVKIISLPPITYFAKSW